MTTFACLNRQRLILAISLFFFAMGTPQESHSRNIRQTHTVQSGESVARIADFYGVSQRDLLELNRLPQGTKLRVGQKLLIPHVLRLTGKRYRVRKGDTLASIAAKHSREVVDLAHANKLDVNQDLQVGRTLVIPDKKNSPKTINVRKVDPESILFLRVVTGEKERLRLYSSNGKLISNAVSRLSYLARDKRGNQSVKRLHFRLIKMIQLVGAQFPGKAIEIISGYRPQSTGTESQHAFGRAIDFRVTGVPLGSVFHFCKKLPRSGCGLYPQSNFVHMDARENKASWVFPKKRTPAKTAKRSSLNQ